MARARVAMKFFVYGLLVGLLFAPRSGEETRRQAIAWINDQVKNVLGLVAGGEG